MRRCLFLLGSLFVLFLLFVPPVYAQTCYAARSIAQFACINGEKKCTTPYRACAGDPSRDCDHCNADGVYYFTGVGPCADFCGNWEQAMTCASTGSYLVACSGPPECQAHPNIVTCNNGTAPDGTTNCATETNQWTYGCWGPGPDTPTPTPGDSSGSTPTPTRTPTPRIAPAGAGLHKIVPTIRDYDKNADLHSPETYPRGEQSTAPVLIVLSGSPGFAVIHRQM